MPYWASSVAFEMFVKWKSIIISIVYVIVKTHSYILKDPDYSPDYYYTSSEHKNDFRRTFLDKRRQNLVTAKRVELIDKYLSNNSVFVDGIIHETINKKHKQWKLVNKIETEFRNLIGMNGVKYYFKRDPYWRTWRKVKYPDGDKMVCYRCESSLNCNYCQYTGYWVIEDNLPCPYEIVSVINNADACTINFENSTNVDKPCPTVAKFTDIMRKCDNPIDTQWRIRKSYKKEVSKLYPAFFCEGRDYCEISTFYTITPDYVSFRIVNSTNHITYSKIMKNNGINYACVSDCGMFDLKTKTVSKTGQPLIVDLINGKNKREDKTKIPAASSETKNKKGSQDLTVFNNKPWTNQPVDKLKMAKLKHAINEMEKVFNLPVKKIEIDDNYHYHRGKKHLTCSSMRQRTEEQNSDEINAFY